ncbi:MAG TPA: diguanylate cyclase [Solirubrobacteraceae bacterium]|jgi:diguanylate cyclase (GGDEF)-like protein
MAADDSTSSFENTPSAGALGSFDWPGPAELDERLQEEIGRAERHGTQLACLLVVVDNLDEMAGEHGGELREQTMAYIAGALHRELRRFDRVGLPSERELLIVLPGADGPRGEMVARRVLDRLRAIKVEARGQRVPLRISVGLAAWRANATPATMLSRARAAAERSLNGENGGAGGGTGGPQNPLGHPAVEEPTSPPS